MVDIEVTYLKSNQDAEQRFANMKASFGKSVIALDLPDVDQVGQWGSDSRLDVVIQDNNIIIQANVRRFLTTSLDFDAEMVDPFGEVMTTFIDKLRKVG